MSAEEVSLSLAFGDLSLSVRRRREPAAQLPGTTCSAAQPPPPEAATSAASSAPAAKAAAAGATASRASWAEREEWARACGAAARLRLEGRLAREPQRPLGLPANRIYVVLRGRDGFELLPALVGRWNGVQSVVQHQLEDGGWTAAPSSVFHGFASEREGRKFVEGARSQWPSTLSV